MRRLHAAALVTLDGVIQDPGGFGETADGGWAGGYFDDEAVADSIEQLAGCDTFLCGRVTYELLSRTWSGADGEYLERINSMPKLVASTTLAGRLDWNAEVIGGDVIERISSLKHEPGKDIIMYGSATLMRHLADHDLVDTYKLSIFPITLGRGRRLFPDKGLRQQALSLTNVKTLQTGVVMLTYTRDSAGSRHSGRGADGGVAEAT
nr:dihydrofolate reductase family protein [Kibdelosporangium sp. MJ126-NF4]CEL19472.1 Dihydrofolate reductase [Kibdelosporangium sp. MJ126-NF4]CTQ94730.1 Dihydrofolate reductase (EC 1.5.1.3) [Kibdelosporangium sp. MJ126-NF4]